MESQSNNLPAIFFQKGEYVTFGSAGNKLPGKVHGFDDDCDCYIVNSNGSLRHVPAGLMQKSQKPRSVWNRLKLTMLIKTRAFVTGE